MRRQGTRDHTWLLREVMMEDSIRYQDLFEQTEPVDVEYRRLEGSEKWVSRVEGPDGKSFVAVAPEALTALTRESMTDIAHLLRPAHLAQLAKILEDEEASDNDRFVALELLKNANVAAGMILPGCQDTGTGIVMGKKGGRVLTEGSDAEHLSRGVYDVYTQSNLRYSQVAPQDMFTEATARGRASGVRWHFTFGVERDHRRRRTCCVLETSTRAELAVPLI